MQGSVAERLAQLYDPSVPDWPDEIDFYRAYVDAAMAEKRPVLEVACGTGRVCLQLARDGVQIVGLDCSREMLDVARSKSAGMDNVRWVQADMRTFDLQQTFGLVIVPGHAFHNLVTADDQVACLDCIARHLPLGGRLVLHLDHQDIDWLGDLYRDAGGVFKPDREATDPQTGRTVRMARAWWYERSTQTATTVAAYEELDEAGVVVDCWKTEPVRLHCLFPFEVAHLLARTGFEAEAVYGDFARSPLTDASDEMVWVAQKC